MATAPPPPAPPAPGSGSHVGVIIASIVGGIILLCLAFGGGAVIGFVVGTHQGGRMVAQEYGGPGFPGWQQGGQGPWQGGPMHRHQQQGQDQDQDQQAPTPAPSPSP